MKITFHDSIQAMNTQAVVERASRTGMENLAITMKMIRLVYASELMNKPEKVYKTIVWSIS